MKKNTAIALTLVFLMFTACIFAACQKMDDPTTGLDLTDAIPSDTTVDDSSAADSSAPETDTEKITEESETTVNPETTTNAPETTKTTETTAAAAVTAISLDKTSLNMNIGDTFSLTYKLSPDNAEKTAVTFSSSNKSAAAVDENGKITAAGEGSAVITASTSNGKTAVCNVTVAKKAIPVTVVTLDKKEITLSIGESFTYNPSVGPANADDLSVILTSSNTGVAKINGFKVTAISAGTATITAKSSNGVFDTSTVTVKESATKAAETTKAPETTAIELPKTNKPIISAKCTISNGNVCISGTCESGATIIVNSPRSGEFEVLPQNNRFFTSVKVTSSEKEMTLTVKAKAEGKQESDSVEVKIKYEKRSVDVYVGKLSQLHYPQTIADFLGTNLYNDDQLKALQKVMEKRLEKVRKLSGKDTKLIYLIAPNNLTIYPETATDQWVNSKKSDDSKMRQIVRLVKKMDNPDIILIDLEDYLISQKSTGKLYFQTDTHWNTYGAYFGYVKLMEAIAVDFPDAAPYGLDKFNVKEIKRDGGDLVSFLGIGNSNGSETTYECTRNYTPAFSPVFNDYFNEMITTVNNSELPTAVFMRDSFTYFMYPFLPEHFSKLTMAGQSAGLSNAMSYVEDAKPDYFIHESVERYVDCFFEG